MVNRIGTIYPWGSNKGFSWRFCVDSQDQYETPEEGWRIYWPKRYEYNNKDEVNSPNIQSNNDFIMLFFIFFPQDFIYLFLAVLLPSFFGLSNSLFPSFLRLPNSLLAVINGYRYLQ